MNPESERVSTIGTSDRNDLAANGRWKCGAIWFDRVQYPQWKRSTRLAVFVPSNRLGEITPLV